MVFALLLSAALQAGVAAPPAQAAPAAPAGREVDCEAYKFESKVMVTDEKGMRPLTLKLCPFKGSTKASWLRTLRDARMKIAASGEIGADDKARLDRELGEAIRNVVEAKREAEVAPKP